MSALYPFPYPLSCAVIGAGRRQVLGRVLQQFPVLRAAPPPCVPAQALPFMLAAYDELFLKGFLARQGGHITIEGSTRMTRAAGKCIVITAPGKPARIQIRMGMDFLLRLGAGPFEANGLRFDTALEAFLSVLEHELCHGLDYLLHRRLDGHGPRFRALSRGLFGHARCTHDLPTRAQEAAQQGLGVGQWVCFAYEGHMLRGRVSRVGKTASVMVPCTQGGYQDAYGERYAKYTVPPDQMRPAEG